MRKLALVTLVAFGCATVRESAPPWVAAPPPVRVAFAEPQIELFVEGAGEPSADESSRALRESEDALRRAFAGRGIADDGEPDAVLVVRERAVTRTAGRRTGQVLAAAGIAVAFVAVIVIAILTSRGGGSKGTAKSAHATSAARGAARGPAGGPAAPLPRAPPPPVVMPPSGAPPVAVEANVAFAVPLVPADAPPPLVPGPPPLEERLALGERGFFDGDEVVLDLELRDARTDALLWQRTVRSGADARDADAVAALVGEALAGEPWAAPRTAQNH